MTAIALAVFIVFIIYVMIWSIRNDGVRSIREQTGYIKMRVPPETPPDKTPEQRRAQQNPAAAKRAGKRKQAPAGPGETEQGPSGPARRSPLRPPS